MRGVVSKKKTGKYKKEGPDPMYNKEGWYKLRKPLGMRCPFAYEQGSMTTTMGGGNNEASKSAAAV